MKYDIFKGNDVGGLYYTKEMKNFFKAALLGLLIFASDIIIFLIVSIKNMKRHRLAIVIFFLNLLPTFIGYVIAPMLPAIKSANRNINYTVIFIYVLDFMVVVINLILFSRIIKEADEKCGYSKIFNQSRYLNDKEIFKQIIQASKDGDAEKIAVLKAELDARCKEKAEKELSERENNKTPYTEEYGGQSKFDATISSFIGLKVVCWLLNIVGLFFFFKPLIICLKERWAKRYSVVDGRRLGFDGTAMELFGSWIIWGILTVITLGIFAFFKPIRVEKWKAKHTSIAGGGKTVKSYFDGWLFQLIGWKMLCKIITLFTLGIAYPFAVCMLMAWQTKHCVYNGYRMKFDGNGFQIFGKWVLWLFLSFITLGIYAFFLAMKIQQWKTKHTHLKQSVEEIMDF